LAILAEFTMISSQTLFLVTEDYEQGRLFSSCWLKLLNSAKAEIVSAALAGLVKVFDQSDDQYVKNSLVETAETTANTVFQLSKSYFNVL
jgi:hypothetical protein